MSIYTNQGRRHHAKRQLIGFDKGNCKVAQVRSRASEKEIAQALSEGFNLSTEWDYSALLTQKQAVRYYNELKNNPLVEAEWSSNIKTDPLI